MRRGNEWFVDAVAAPDLIAEASQRSIKVLGLDAFLIDDGDLPGPQSDC